MCVFKAITVQIQGTRSLPAGVAWFFPLNVWQFKAKVEKVVLVHNSFFVCLFESFFFFLTNLASLRANRARVERKGKKSIFFFLHPSRLNFVYFHTLFLRWRIQVLKFFLKLRSFTPSLLKTFETQFIFSIWRNGGRTCFLTLAKFSATIVKYRHLQLYCFDGN